MGGNAEQPQSCSLCHSLWRLMMLDCCGEHSAIHLPSPPSPKTSRRWLLVEPRRRGTPVRINPLGTRSVSFSCATPDGRRYGTRCGMYHSDGRAIFRFDDFSRFGARQRRAREGVYHIMFALTGMYLRRLSRVSKFVEHRHEREEAVGDVPSWYGGSGCQGDKPSNDGRRP